MTRLDGAGPRAAGSPPVNIKIIFWGSFMRIRSHAGALLLADASTFGTSFIAVPPALAQFSPCDGSNINCVDVTYTCNYDVLCDGAGNVIPGPMSGVRLGNGQICAGNGCTRP